MTGRDYYCVDLHVHTALSPCAENEMTPRAIVEHAQNSHLHVIAITDHNSAANVAAVKAAAAGADLIVIPGMEVETREEVHVLTLFPNLKQVLAWQEIVDQALPPGRNVPEVFGRQLIFDDEGRQRRECSKLLLQATRLTVDEVFRYARQLGGIAIPAHVDRSSYSMINTLGFVPPELQVRVLEYSRYCEKRNIPGFHGIVSSDAHRLSDLYGSPATALLLEELSTEAVLAVLDNPSDEKVVIF